MQFLLVIKKHDKGLSYRMKSCIMYYWIKQKLLEKVQKGSKQLIYLRPPIAEGY